MEKVFKLEIKNALIYFLYQIKYRTCMYARFQHFHWMSISEVCSQLLSVQTLPKRIQIQHGIFAHHFYCKKMNFAQVKTLLKSVARRTWRVCRVRHATISNNGYIHMYTQLQYHCQHTLDIYFHKYAYTPCTYVRMYIVGFHSQQLRPMMDCFTHTHTHPHVAKVDIVVSKFTFASRRQKEASDRERLLV